MQWLDPSTPTTLLLLAFDCTGDGCSAGVYDDAGSRTERHRSGTSGHAEHLLPMVEAVLADAGTGWRELDGIAVSRGPGSFTGIRTGLAAARGLALATGLPVLPVTGFAALALSTPAGTSPIAAAIDVRRGQVHMQLFDSDGCPEAEPVIGDPADLAARLEPPCRLVGSGAALLAARLAWPVEICEVRLDAAAVARAARLGGVVPVAGHLVEPLYSRTADARPDAGRSLLVAGA